MLLILTMCKKSWQWVRSWVSPHAYDHVGPPSLAKTHREWMSFHIVARTLQDGPYTLCIPRFELVYYKGHLVKVIEDDAVAGVPHETQSTKTDVYQVPAI